MASSNDVTFAWRSNTITAYYAPGGEQSCFYDQGQSTLAQIVDYTTTGFIGDKALNLNSPSFNCWRQWSGIGNTPNTSTFSIVYRFGAGSAGTATSSESLFQLGGDTSSYHGAIGVGRVFGSDTLVALLRNELGQTGWTSQSIAAYTFTTIAAHDLVLVGQNTGTSLNVKFYLDGTLLSSQDGSRQYNFSTVTYPWNTITLGRYVNGNVSNHYANELLIFQSALSAASIASAFPGPTRSAFYSLTSYQPLNSSSITADIIQDSKTVILNGNTITGTYSFGTYTNLTTTSVVFGESWIFADVTYTGSRVVPVANTGAAGTVPINNIKEQIRYALYVNNTATGAPTLDLSSNMSTRVKGIFKLNPEVIPLMNNAIPGVCIFTESKNPIELKGINVNSLNGKRKADVNFKIVGMVYQPNYQANKLIDPADDELEYLMENIERVLRAYDDLGKTVNWQMPSAVTYHNVSWDEDTHFRAGILDLKVTILY